MQKTPVRVQIGDEVVICDRSNGRRVDIRRGTIIKVARVWIEIQPEGNRYVERFRLDDQTNGQKWGIAPRFYTLGQWDERERQNKAAAFLCDQGISINFGSPWRGREIELADLIQHGQQVAGPAS